MRKTTSAVLILTYYILGCAVDSPSPHARAEDAVETADKAPARAAIIPGIAAVDVYGSMKDAGLRCSGPNFGSEIAEWRCKESTGDHEYVVEIIGRFPTEIEVIKATSLNFGSRNTDAVARDFLSYVATVPYRGSNPAAAKAWVQQNVGKHEVEKTFGRVRIQLFSNARARMLRMSHVEAE